MNDEKLDEWFEEAQRAWRECREATAVEILARYVERRPDHARAWFIFGDALHVRSGASKDVDGVLRRLSSFDT